MKKIAGFVVGMVCLMVVAGCQTTGTDMSAGKSSSPMIGQSVADVIAAHAGQKIEIYDEGGNKVEAVPEKATGSVSIYNKEVTGQDNYTFDKKGKITKHLRSYGEDFPAGKWEEVK